MQQGKTVFYGGLANSWEKKSERQRRKENIYPSDADFQKMTRKDKKAFLSEQCREIEENNIWERLRDLKKTGYTKWTFHAKMYITKTEIV